MSERIPDGSDTIEVSLSGGTGRASIESPTPLTISDGKMKAEIKWSSSNYDYMKVNEREYYPEKENGHSVFQIDIDSLNTEIPITAETVAMSTPHMIEYTLIFDSSTIKNQDSNSTTVIPIIGIAIIIISSTAFFLRRKRKHAKV